MPFNGNGQFDPASPQYPAVAGTVILATDWNTIVADIATGLSLAWTRDGQAGALAPLSMGGFRLTTLANAIAAQDAVTLTQLTSNLTTGGLLTTLNAAILNITSPILTVNSTSTWLGTHNFTGGTLNAATQLISDISTKVATTAFVNQVAFNAALPAQSAATIGKAVVSDGTNASWTTINVNGGATETTSAVDIVLTSASTRVQAVSMTVASKSVTLPNATTLTTGGALFVIKNTGTIKFPIRNASGVLVTVLGVEQIAAFYLSNNSTSAGVWAVGNQSGTAFEAMFLGAITTVNAVASTYIAVTPLSATQAIVTYKGTTGYIETCVLTVSGTTVTAGAVLAVNAVASDMTSVTALSATQAIVAYRGTTSYLQVCTLNISGTTVTAGAILTINAVNSPETSVTALSATQAIVAYRNFTTTFMQTCTLNVSGTTITAGAILTVTAVQSNYPSVSKLTATQVIVVYRSAASTFAETCTLNISGTTVTAGAILAVSTADCGEPFVAALSGTQAILSHGSAGVLQLRTLNISGTTVTAGAVLTPTGAATGQTPITRLSATQALIAFRGTAGYLECYVAKINGTTVTAGSVFTVHAININYPAVAAISATQTVITYSGVSGFLQTVSLEVPL